MRIQRPAPVPRYASQKHAADLETGRERPMALYYSRIAPARP
jgi:hypothetical protein